ncbi:MAG: ABC transporter ATP-binding protein [Thermoanaerobaculia bacterium]|nr:ABC transporter ATP-binding protein [Thermoanaerobaculia bacterium]
MEQELLIQIRNLWKRYQRTWVLEDLSLDVPAGEVLLLAGANGAGKSTLLRILSTAVRAEEGTTLINGLSLEKERPDVRRTVALLSHATYTYDFLTARENLEIWNGHLPEPQDESVIEPILDRVGLLARADDQVGRYSAGMRKRLAFGRVLLQARSEKTRVILLDEPYEQLDRDGFSLVDSLAQEWKSQNRAVVLATHFLDRAVEVVDRGLLLRAGQIDFLGEPKGVITRLTEGSAS